MIPLNQIEPGWQADAWFAGPVAESYPVQASASLLIVQRPPVADSSVLFQTDSQSYTLRAGDVGYTALIGMRFTNRTADTTYFVNCRGTTGVGLEKLVNGVWQHVWSPAMFACLSPPIAVPPGGVRSMPIDVFAGYPGSNNHPQFSIPDIPGSYRAVWTSALTHYQDRLPFGNALSLAHRISNRFTLRVPAR